MAYSGQTTALKRLAIVIDGGQDEVRARLLQAVRSFCPAWLREHEEDITQAAMMRLLSLDRSHAGNEPRTLTSAYLRQVAYGCTIDEIRRSRRRLRTESPIEPEPAGGDGRDPESLAAAGEIGRGIFDCLSTLVTPRRRAVTLHLVGHTAPEIGGMLGWSVKKTESLIYRGLDNLRRCLKSKGLQP